MRFGEARGSIVDILQKIDLLQSQIEVYIAQEVREMFETDAKFTYSLEEIQKKKDEVFAWLDEVSKATKHLQDKLGTLKGLTSEEISELRSLFESLIMKIGYDKRFSDFVNMLRASVQDFDKYLIRIGSEGDRIRFSKEKKEELVFPKEILENLPTEVKKTIEGVILNYEHDFPEFCFWGMRKALIDAIRLRFIKDRKEKMLYDEKGNPYSLPKWIELVKQETYISAEQAKNLEKVKVFGDSASHDYMTSLHKKEVPSILFWLRLALSRMFYKEEK